jgi:amphi-Trp domain-containing protein
VTDPDDVAGFFASLIEGFKNRRMSVSADDKKLTLQPGEILEMTLETVQRKGRVKMTVSISWPDHSDRQPNLFDLPEPARE